MSLPTERRESQVEEVFKRACEKEGWIVRKMQWPGHRGGMDRIVLAPLAVCAFAEVKRSEDEELSAHQATERELLLKLDQIVHVVRTEMDVARFVATVRREIRQRSGR